MLVRVVKAGHCAASGERRVRVFTFYSLDLPNCGFGVIPATLHPFMVPPSPMNVFSGWEGDQIRSQIRVKLVEATAEYFLQALLSHFFVYILFHEVKVILHRMAQENASAREVEDWKRQNLPM